MPHRPTGLLVLGHGAGGGVNTNDLVAAADAGRALGWAVGGVLQPYRLAGRRTPAPAGQLDAAWLAVLTSLRARREFTPVPVVVGGRSSGARVACRTASQSGAVAVLALAFPLHPPGRPERSRAIELTEAATPIVVVQGERDAFGSAADIAALQVDGVAVHAVPGADHALRGPAAATVVRTAVADLLGRFSA
jgi:uncharacterized protein